MATGKTAKELKELGNAAFAANDYDQAIVFYTKAITVDPGNHVYYSNRSASYGQGLNDWDRAAEDAKECIRLDPTFIKGYYRLATAQIEMRDWDGATSTIKQGLNVDANNAQLLKQLNQVQQYKKAAAKSASAAAPGAVPTMDSAASKELMDLQQQYIRTSREYATVQANITKAQREQKSNEITKSEVEKYPDDNSKLYRSVGKMFLLSGRSDIIDHLTKSIEDETKQGKDLTQKLDYLERRMKSQRQNMEELARSPTSAE